MRNAVLAWQREVLNRYGRRFTEFEKAKLCSRECSNLIGNKWVKSCTVTAFPCSVSVGTPDDIGPSILLGERTVEKGMTRDIVNIERSEDWHRDRFFRALRFSVDDNTVMIDRIRLNYVNGYREEIEMNRRISPDRDFWLRLRGERRYVARIDVFYPARANRQKALLRVYGERDLNDEARDRPR